MQTNEKAPDVASDHGASEINQVQDNTDANSCQHL